MGNKTVLEELDSQISLVLEKYDALKIENRILKERLSSTDERESQLRQEILRLKEEDELKDLELEDIALRIGKSMGLTQNMQYAS